MQAITVVFGEKLLSDVSANMPRAQYFWDNDTPVRAGNIIWVPVGDGKALATVIDARQTHIAPGTLLRANVYLRKEAKKKVVGKTKHKQKNLDFDGDSSAPRSQNSFTLDKYFLVLWTLHAYVQQDLLFDTQEALAVDLTEKLGFSVNTKNVRTVLKYSRVLTDLPRLDNLVKRAAYKNEREARGELTAAERRKAAAQNTSTSDNTADELNDLAAQVANLQEQMSALLKKNRQS